MLLHHSAGRCIAERVVDWVCAAMVQENGLGEPEARFCFQQLVMALDYCHCLGVSVRDIKVLALRCSDRSATWRPTVAPAAAYEEPLL